MKSNNFEYFLPNLEKPFRYLGCEYGNVRKEFTENMLRFALVSPETYELGMSHLGLKILYKVLKFMQRGFLRHGLMRKPL